MSSLSSVYSSSTAHASLISAFMMKSQSNMLDGLFAASRDPEGVDTFQLANSMPIFDASFYSSMQQGSNMAVFGSVYKDAAGFNDALMSSVAASSGMNWDLGAMTGSLFNGLA
jgi:hypothetical protein